MKPICFSEIPTVAPDLVARTGALAVSDLHEGLGPLAGRLALMNAAMRPLNAGQRMFGQAVTCLAYPGDNLALHLGLHVARQGQVIVATNGTSGDGALWGELAATLAQTKGIAGVIVDGSIRDTDALRGMNFPVWSTAISPSHPEKRGPAAVNIPIVCAGVRVDPGDLIVADGDGVIAIPRALIQQAFEGTSARAAREVEIRKGIAEGKTLFDMLGLEKSIAAAGLEMKQGTWLDAGNPR
jgi:4-hydroxy-4-methyl-2-oxoglutarate aldolase